MQAGEIGRNHRIRKKEKKKIICFDGKMLLVRRYLGYAFVGADRIRPNPRILASTPPKRTRPGAKRPWLSLWESWQPERAD